MQDIVRERGPTAYLKWAKDLSTIRAVGGAPDATVSVANASAKPRDAESRIHVERALKSLHNAK
jgi:hypothetical protein